MWRRDESFLRSLPMFRDCSASELSAVQRLVERLPVRAGEILVREGSLTKEFFILVRGCAEVQRGGRLVSVLQPGECFGELALLDPAPRNATVRMRDDGEVLAVAQPAFWTLLRDHSSLSVRLLGDLAQRLHREQHVRIQGESG